MEEGDGEFVPEAPTRHYPVDTAGRTPFSKLCKLFEALSKTSVRGGIGVRSWNSDAKSASLKEKRQHMLKQFMSEWRDTQGDFYPAMRLLLPQYDRERSTYGLKESTLAKVYIAVLGLPKEAHDAQALVNYRDPGKSKNQNTGDFAGILEQVLGDRSTVRQGTLTIRDVNRYLDELNATEKTKDTYTKIFKELYTKCTPLEQKWLARIILKNMKMGTTEKTIFQEWHGSASDMWSVTSSLRSICDDLYDPEAVPQTQEVTLGSAFRPMLCERFKGEFNDIPKLMNNEPFWVEIKLDGERIQVHKDGENYKYFSRKGKDYTHLYGATVQEGCLTSYLDEVLLDQIDSCVLDGEIIVYDPMVGQFESFGKLKTAALDVEALNDPHAKRPCLRVFDILTVNGKSLESASLRKRREILQNIMGESKGRVEFHPFKTCSTGEDVMRALDDAILNNEEGIVIKNPRSKYVPDGRLPLWIKIKPDYVEGLSDPVDLAVIGGWYGSGGRGKLVSHYLCAVQGPRNEVDGTMTYRTFCKVGSGMNYKEMEGVSKLPWRQFNRDKPPKWLQAGRALKVTPDVILDPQHFPIVAVKAEKIVPSAEYAIGYTLRFPRLQAFRHDKPNEDIWTENEVEGAMNRATEGRLTKRMHDGSVRSEIKRRKTGRAIPLSVISSHHLPMDLQPSDKGPFLNCNIYVMPAIGQDGSDDELRTIQALVAENGGSLKNTASAAGYVIADLPQRFKVHNLIKANTHDILRSIWVRDCVEAGRFLEPTPKYFLHMTPKTSREKAVLYDPFGDSYVDDIADVNELKALFSRVDVKAELARLHEQAADAVEIRETSNFIPPIISKVKIAADERYFDERPHLGLFRGKIIFVDVPPENPGERAREAVDIRPEGLNSSLRITKELLLFYGASVVEKIHPNVTHIVVDPTEPGRGQAFWEPTMESKPRHHIVQAEWVIESVREGYALEESDFTAILKSQTG